MKILLAAAMRSLLEARLPAAVEPLWYDTADDAVRLAPEAEVAWADIGPERARAMLHAAPALRWLSTMGAGVNTLDLDSIAARGIILTNGSGLNAAAVADYAVMGILVGAKRFDKVLRQAATRAWTQDAPGRLELDGSRALVIGQGTIGTMIAERLRAFGVAVTGATRSGRDGTLAADAWRGRLGTFDWVVIGAPATGETRAMIGAQELAAMKPTAWLVNIARGDLVDQPALIAALEAGEIGGAFLDTVSPEPLPADDPLWFAPNCIVTMHLSGRSQTGMAARAADLFLANLDAWIAGLPLRNIVDPATGY